MWTIVKGLVTNLIPFASQWWKGKQEEAMRELDIKQQESLTRQNIKLERVRSEVTNTSERIKQMANSFKDEFTMIVIFFPFITSMISPYVDLFYALKEKAYQQGMLADASLKAIEALDSFPIWYTLVVILMILYSWGASKEVISKFFDMFSFNKK
ncbi:hypothetical protein AXI76_gp194 [Pseudoalteromonas phage H101]|jgi:hypothetical protein|uniref:Uncharacterized protein n=1 Tax=Pseudoalteromonas phage H101 TaxID=1654919 RepID=A0A0H4J2C6_9CAUD|nr:hypothetical protein AXI76_gp194 [Pseudoalteromonas phage H101]AKO61095.1 hypothetical protein [Pseudoalteromonas phage H101]|tara:strand:- start:196 stop:660 length:465 start_codon:yes stop_codon:yes gene_type:complete